MGYYYEGHGSGKAESLILLHAGREVSQAEAALLVDSHGVFAIKRNAMFEAAGFCYDADEFAAFTEPSDPRPTRFVVVDRELAHQMSGREVQPVAKPA